jgi:hypothetical protein
MNHYETPTSTVVILKVEKSLLQGSPNRDYNEDKNEKMIRDVDVDF